MMTKLIYYACMARFAVFCCLRTINASSLPVKLLLRGALYPEWFMGTHPSGRYHCGQSTFDLDFDHKIIKQVYINAVGTTSTFSALSYTGIVQVNWGGYGNISMRFSESGGISYYSGGGSPEERCTKSDT